MPIVSQSRTIKVPGHPGKYTRLTAGAQPTTKWLDTNTDVGGAVDITQSTTSFRGSASDDYDKESGSEILRGIRSEYKLRFDNGHEFRTEKKYTIEPNDSISVTFSQTGAEYKYVGAIHPNALFPASGRYPAASTPDLSAINADGRRLIAATIPTRPEVSLAQILGELREKLPSLVGYQTYRAGVHPDTVGSEYLNVEFGWKPMISDVQNFAKAVADASRTIKQYTSNDGKIVRRKAHLDSSVSWTQLANAPAGTLSIPRMNGSAMTGVMFPGFSDSRQIQVSISDEVKQKVWFSGAYSYYLAEAHSFLEKIERYEQLANHLLGIRITPEVIWELTPWSWLLDWFGDFGTFVSNITALTSDNLVLRYGYVMHETRACRHRYIPLQSATQAGKSCNSGTYSDSYVVTKQRHRATPYGFGLSVPSFTGRQWSILGALGLTKSPTSLRYLD